jgi:hypothetical protein
LNIIFATQTFYFPFGFDVIFIYFLGRSRKFDKEKFCFSLLSCLIEKAQKMSENKENTKFFSGRLFLSQKNDSSLDMTKIKSILLLI